MADRPLTEKEQRVVDSFDSARPGLGAIARSNILNNSRTGWADRIAEMPGSEIFVTGGEANAN